MSLIQALSRIDDFLSQNVPEQLSAWGYGLNDEQINDLVKDIPYFFPEELRELYRWHNGSEYYWISQAVYPFLSLESAVEYYEYSSNLPEIWEPQFFWVFGPGKDVFFVDIQKDNSPVWYQFLESPVTEIFWSSITKMMQTIADAYETGAFYLLDNGYFASDGKKFLEVMWKNAPDIISSLMDHLRTVKEERLNNLISHDISIGYQSLIGYESIERFVWEDISELLQAIRSTSDDSVRAEMIQEFTSAFLGECERIIRSVNDKIPQ